MTAPKFQVGDVVRLKSETQKMTVEELIFAPDLAEQQNVVGYKCVWLDNGFKTGSFTEETLVLAE